MNNSQTVPISIIIITDRADLLFAQVLESINPAAEILIESYGAEVDWSEWKKKYSQIKVTEHKKRVDDFSQARNQALSHAAQPWVFFLDSDEVVVPDSWIAIRNVVAKNHVVGAYVARHDYYFGKKLRWGEVANIWLLRLAQRDKVTFFRPIHEWAEVDGPTARVPVEINHYSHQSATEFLQTVAGYAKREALFRHSTGTRFFWPELVGYPIGKWLFNVCGRFAFLDGWRGMTYALMMSLHSLLVRIYLYELEKHHR